MGKGGTTGVCVISLLGSLGAVTPCLSIFSLPVVARPGLGLPLDNPVPDRAAISSLACALSFLSHPWLGAKWSLLRMFVLPLGAGISSSPLGASSAQS